MRRPVVLLAVAVLATAALVVAGLAVFGGLGGGGADTGGTGSGGGSARDAASTRASASPFTTTPLSAYDTGNASVARAPFCDHIDPRQVVAALGADPTSQRSWANGDRTRLGGGPTDVAHEDGCEYVAADGSAARAWVFAPPVRTSIATRLASQTDGAGDCTSVAATYGAPSGLLTCHTARQRSATYRGLFGDAWLSCEVDLPLTTPAPTVTDRAGRWCVGVLQAAAAR